MKTKKENTGIFENKCFDVLRNDELLQIKGGTEDENQGGTDTVRDSDFE
jgi:hypothetical protein